MPDAKRSLRALAFKEQVDFINDSSKFKAAICSRRAGKTFACAIYLFSEALRVSGSKLVYVALTRASAKRILWPELQSIARKHGLGVQFNGSELTATLPNGSIIYLFGAEDSSEIEKLLGAAYLLAVLDECASFKSHIKPLVENILEPAMIDRAGTICMIGTPNAACVGYFHDVTNLPQPGRKKWAIHKWTLRDNPHLPDVAEWLDNKKAENNWQDDNPSFLRDYCGIWVRSEESLVYRYQPSRDDAAELGFVADAPEYILGLDLGFDDATAFSVCAFGRSSPIVAVVETWQRSGLSITEVVAQLQRMERDYGGFTRIVGDTGGLGKQIVAEINQRHEIGIQPAEKKNKYEYIELLNDDLRQGKVKVLPGAQELRDEWRILQWDADELAKGRRIEDSRCPNHLSDATLYAWREALHYRYEAPAKAILYGTKEWFQGEEKRLEALEIGAIENRERAVNMDDFTPDWGW